MRGIDQHLAGLKARNVTAQAEGLGRNVTAQAEGLGKTPPKPIPGL